MSQMREFLRSLPSLAGRAPAVPTELPDEPVQLFREWLDQAVAAGVPEPHAMTLSTVDAEGMADARVLILKDVDERGWAFASTASSRKGEQLAVHPAAALTFWWQPQVRSVRVSGAVEQATAGECAADLAARSATARQGVDPQDWRLWRVIPTRIEFWQGSADRNHVRIVYERADATARWRRRR